MRTASRLNSSECFIISSVSLNKQYALRRPAQNRYKSKWLKRSLTVYRLAFGQPRQEDLMQYLHSLVGTTMPAEDLADLKIRLQP